VNVELDILFQYSIMNTNQGELMNKTLLVILMTSSVACSTLVGLATKALVPGATSGINTELVVGDKEQVLGANIEVDAKSVNKIVGNSDNSTAIKSAKAVEVNNTNVSVGLVALIVSLALLVGWLSPRPQAWKRLIGKKDK
jgi:hypothetical protein